MSKSRDFLFLSSEAYNDAGPKSAPGLRYDPDRVMGRAHGVPEPKAPAPRQDAPASEDD
jgi:hypothetical protein